MKQEKRERGEGEREWGAEETTHFQERQRQLKDQDECALNKKKTHPSPK
jgi:hypothetical protein